MHSGLQIFTIPSFRETCTCLQFCFCNFQSTIKSLLVLQVLPISSTEALCHGPHGLLFVADSTCGQFFPRFPICDESRVSSVISSCSDTDIIMSANSTHSMRFWLSYYGMYRKPWMFFRCNIILLLKLSYLVIFLAYCRDLPITLCQSKFWLLATRKQLNTETRICYYKDVELCVSRRHGSVK